MGTQQEELEERGGEEKRREEKKVGDINYRRNCYLVDGLMGGYICM